LVRINRAGQEDKGSAKDPVPGQLGLEKYQHYVGEDLGGGMQHLVNVANGNGSLRFTPFLAPGRGLNTVVDLTSNSREDQTKSPAGNAWSASVSGLIRLGEPLTFSPAGTRTNSGNNYVQLTDGDGTVHQFNGSERGPTGAKKRVWDEPPGVHLHLRKYSSTDATRRWAVTRPDRVTFFFNAEGWPTFVRDRNGNELIFEYETPAAADDHGAPRPQLRRVRDAGGRVLNLNYYLRDKPAPTASGTGSGTQTVPVPALVRGRLKEIVDHTGSALLFDYYDDGNLRRLTQRGYDRSPGSATDAVDASSVRTQTPDRSWTFSYVTSNLQGAAIASDKDRRDPSPSTANQSAKPFGVIDPKGKETVFTYAGTSAAERGRVTSVTDRLGAAGARTDFSYDTTKRLTTVTADLAKSGSTVTRATTRFTYAVAGGRVTSVLDPLGQCTDVTWTVPPLTPAAPAAYHVARITEPYLDGTPATLVGTDFTYDANGYLTSQTDQEGNRTVLTYFNPEATLSGGDLDLTDGAAYRFTYADGSTRPGHISELATKTAPEGVATTSDSSDFRYDFGYDGVGNLRTVTAPTVDTSDAGVTRPVTEYFYGTFGLVSSMKDPRGNTTQYRYTTGLDGGQANGMPTSVTDALNRISRRTYDRDGLVRTQTDARGTATTYTYDAFHRLGMTQQPKLRGLSTQNITTGAQYDPNDNVTAQFQPGYQPLHASDRTGFTYDAMDRLLTATGPDTSVIPGGETTTFRHDVGGRLIRQVLPIGTASTGVADDHATDFSYDALDRLTTVKRHQVTPDGTALKPSLTHRCYDTVGNLVRVIAPNAELAAPQCTVPTTHTTTLGYDKAHRLISSSDPENRLSQRRYDRNSNVKTVTDAARKLTALRYDQRDMLIEVDEPFTATQRLISRRQYDRTGNLTREISPRAVGAAGGGAPDRFVTRHDYDVVDQLTRTVLPSAQLASSSDDKRYLHRKYDNNGWVSDLTQVTDSATFDGTPPASRSHYDYYDTGWIRISDDNLTTGTAVTGDPSPPISFDYTAEGWMSSRSTARRVDDFQYVEEIKTMAWRHRNDGQVFERTDEGTQTARYRYDGNNNLREADEVGGATSAGAVAREIRLDYDPVDRPARSREREQRLSGPAANYNTTTFGYDLNDNLTDRRENIELTPSDTVVAGKAGRQHTFTYTTADWLRTQLDEGADSTAGVLADDQLITTLQDDIGRETSRLIQRRTDATSYADKQLTTWNYFDNGKLRKLSTTAGGALTEEHDLEYFQDGLYLNGHRVKDTYFRKSDGSTAKCTELLARCAATYRYDARERLVEDNTGYGDVTTFELTPAGSVGKQTELPLESWRVAYAASGRTVALFS
jgi:YD repeat-containing protein